ncbi:hypothetical protein F5Y09DRAFT_316452 [Xylaria sp. FL1042]|nr:hypothetical protein F5Y09DRAFT_316452 [Xylaria sp. FL1042]
MPSLSVRLPIRSNHGFNIYTLPLMDTRCLTTVALLALRDRTPATQGRPCCDSRPLVMAPRLRRRQEACPGPIPTTRRCTRSSVSLRGARVAKFHAQSWRDRTPPRSKDTTPGASKNNKNSLVEDHASSYRRRLDHVAWPQRSSIRRALRESQELSDGIISPTTTTSILPNPATAKTQLPPREPENPAQGIQTGVRGGSVITHPPAPKIMPQRNSLRRAIRESLMAIDAGHGNSIPSAYLPKVDLTQASGPTLGPVKKLGAEALNLAVGAKNSKRDNTSLSQNSQGAPVSLATPQRSSLRRAVRESLRTTIQSNAYLDIASDGISSTQGNIMKNITEKSPPISDVQRDDITSVSNSPKITLIPLEANDLAKKPPRYSRTSSISSNTASPASLTPVFPRLLTVLRPRTGPISESYPVAKSPVSQPLSSSGLSSRLVSTPELCDESKSAMIVSRLQSPSITLVDQNGLDSRNLRRIPDNAQSTPVRKGWHQVREITNEVPGGLYLVEWEGQDPRTGVKWPASWVKAQNVSESAIRDWDKRKHQMLLSSRETMRDLLLG